MTDVLSPAEEAKKAAAAAALTFIQPDMKVGLGTGSTAAWLVKLLAARMAEEGFSITAVATSSVTTAQAESLGISISDLDDVGGLDLTIDGADEFDPSFNLIKGAGGALLQEKIVAAASDRMIVITDPSKQVMQLGAFALPVEVVRFGWRTTEKVLAGELASLGFGQPKVSPRRKDGELYITDEGHHLLDLHLGKIPDAASLELALNNLPGVVDNGLFVGRADTVVVGLPEGRAQVLTR